MRLPDTLVPALLPVGQTGSLMPHTFSGHRCGAGLLPCAPSFRSSLPKCKLLPNRWNRLCSSVQNAEQKLGGGAEAPTPQGILQKECGIWLPACPASSDKMAEHLNHQADRESAARIDPIKAATAEPGYREIAEAMPQQV